MDGFIYITWVDANGRTQNKEIYGEYEDIYLGTIKELIDAGLDFSVKHVLKDTEIDEM